MTPSSGQGSGRVEFDAAANPAGTARQGHVAINDVQASVQQQPAVCRFEVSPTTTSVDGGGGSVTVAVTTLPGCGWEVKVDVGWISASTVAGTGTGSTTIRVAPSEGEERSAAFLVAGQVVRVTQSLGTATSPGSTACSYSISPATQSVSAAGGAGAVTISTAVGCAWMAASQASWITLTSPATGSGPGTVTFVAGVNSGGARSGTIGIAGQTSTISQAAAAAPPVCTYSINPSEQAIDDKGGSITVSVSAGAGCAWTATSNETWIVITEGASGAGNGTVRFEVEGVHGKGNRRTGTLTIAGRTFTVDQDKKND